MSRAIGVVVGVLVAAFALDAFATRAILTLDERVKNADYVVVGKLTSVDGELTVMVSDDAPLRFAGVKMTYSVGLIEVTDILQGPRWQDEIPVFFRARAQTPDGEPYVTSLYGRLEFPTDKEAIWLLTSQELVGGYELAWQECHVPLDSLAAVKRYAVLESGRRYDD